MSVYVIRHAESLYNKSLTLYKSLNKSKNEILSLDYNAEMIDCLLSEEGVFQASKLSKVIEDLNINLIFCSPLRRAIMTLNLIYHNFQKNQYPVIYIHPIFRERLSTSSSISLYGTKEYQGIFDEKFSYNLDLMKKYTNYWLLQEINSQISNKIIRDSENDVEKMKKIILFELEQKALGKTEGIEPRKTDEIRAQSCHNFLRTIVNKNEFRGNVLVVSHGHLLKQLVGIGAENTNGMQISIENAEIYKLSL